MVKPAMSRHFDHFSANCFRKWIGIAVALVFCILLATATTHAGEKLRFVYSQSMFKDVKESDARAAMRVWLLKVAAGCGLSLDPEPVIARDIDGLFEACKMLGTVGCAMTLPEFARLHQEIDFAYFGIGIVNGVFTQEYLLLTRRDSGLERIDQLKGRRLRVFDNPSMSLALPWLDTLLLEAGLAPNDVWFGKITMDKSANQTALPVFFGKVDACVLTRSSFEVMAELNPQLQHQLQVIAVSAPVVPVGFALRADTSGSNMAALKETIDRLHESPSGLQILHLMQSERAEIHPIAMLDPSLALFARYQRLRGDAGRGIAP